MNRKLLRNPSCHAHGFMLLDVLTGLAMAGVLLLVLALSAAEYRRGSRALTDQRVAQTAAETALLDLQGGAQAHADTPAADAPRVKITRLPDASPVMGRQWVEVNVTYRQRQVTLVGLAPSMAPEAHP